MTPSLRLSLRARSIHLVLLVWSVGISGLLQVGKAQTPGLSSLKIPDKTMEIRIQDNGKGFVAEERAEAGNGLSSIKKRAADIGATIDIHSQPGCGTTVVLLVRV